MHLYLSFVIVSWAFYFIGPGKNWPTDNPMGFPIIQFFFVFYFIFADLLASSRVLQLRAPTGGDFVFPRRFTVILASGSLAVVGGGGLDESTEDVYIPSLIRSSLNMVGSDLPVSLSPALARLGSASSMASAALPVLCRATSLVTTLAASL